jgi:copper chaperone CopZ
MGCPDAVRAELLRLPGVMSVSYNQEQDYFSVSFESIMVEVAAIFAAVYNAGRQMGQEYLPALIQ